MRTELSHSARRLPPQRHRVRALRPNKRRNDRVCHRVSNNEDTDPHTISNALLVLAMINKGKLYSYQNARFFKQTSQWRRKSWWCNLPAALILWHAGSDVMGCRRPTGGVFKYVSSDTSHAEAFPVATPRGRSSSSHEGELKILLQNKLFTPKISVMRCFCGDIVYEILSADMKSSLYIVVINIFYYSNDILFLC